MTQVRQFFTASDFMEHELLRPLDHIRPNWELVIDPETGRYYDGEDSFAWLFNQLIDELELAKPPTRYHDSEDSLGEHVRKSLNWGIRKQGGNWVNANGARLHPTDYLAMLEQGGFKTDGDSDLIEAVAGRIKAAIDRGQTHFDDVERSHQVVLAGVVGAILYHREPHEAWHREQARNATTCASNTHNQ